MYPGDDVLREIGRVAIAGARLDIWIGWLWHHIDRGKDPVEARRASGSEQRRAVRRLAEECLEGRLRVQVLNVVTAAQRAQQQRHEVIHQDWTLRTLERVVAAQELADRYGDAWPQHIDEVERYAHESANWQRVPARSLDIDAAPTVTELIAIERELTRVTELVTLTVRDVAASRETGTPPGYRHVPDKAAPNSAPPPGIPQELR